MSTLDVRVAKWNLRADAGTTETVVVQWFDTDGDPFTPDTSSIYLGGTSADQDDYTGADEIEGTIDGNDVTFDIPIPDALTSVRMRMEANDTLITTGILSPSALGVGTSDPITVNLGSNTVTISATLAGEAGAGTVTSVAEVDPTSGDIPRADLITALQGTGSGDLAAGNAPAAAVTAHAGATGVHTIAGVTGLQAALDAKATPADLLAADHRALFVLDPDTDVDGTATDVQIIDAVTGEASGSPIPVATLVGAGLTRVLIATPIGSPPTWDTSRVGIWDITASGAWTLVARPNGRQRIHVGRTVGSLGVGYETITMRGANFDGPFGTVDLDEPSVLFEPDLPIPHAHRVPLMCQRLFYGGGTEDWLDASDGTGVAASNMLDGLEVATGTVVWVTHAADSDQCGPWRIDGDPTVVPPFPIPDSAGLQEVMPDQILELTPVFVGNGARWGGTVWLTRLETGFRGRDLMPVRPNLAGLLVDGSDEVADEDVWDDETGAVWMRDTDTDTGQGFRRLTTADVDGSWTVVADVTLADASAQVDIDITGFSSMRGMIVGRSDTTASGQAGLRARLNGDSGNNYSASGGGATSFATLGNLPGSQTNTDRTGRHAFSMDRIAGSWTVGESRSVAPTSTATTAPSVNAASFAWMATTTPTLLSFYLGTGSFAAGTRIYLEAR